ncbi:MAG: hypothetical protein IJC48_01860 [Clostridia bacterium]|nr:hypothetical protein [Clostridia bacterium]
MAIKTYPLPEGECQNTLYEIFIDGKRVQAHSARVSLMPFNRHWPGHQRTMDQTEVIPFVSFDMDEKAHVRVISQKAFKNAIVRPSSKKITPVCSGREIEFDIEKTGQYSLELDGVYGALQIFANPFSNYSVFENDPDTLYFGPGIHDAGTINMHSGQTVYIHEEAVVYGEIHATDAENIRILGRGILDHGKIDAKEGAINSGKNTEEVVDPFRPSPMYFTYCKNILIEGITIRDPAFLALRPIACENVEIDNVKIIGCWRYNSDGIDFINTIHGRARNCYVRSFDDSLCLKGFYFLNQGEMFHNGKAYPVMDDVMYENCVVWNDWGKALEVGVDLCAMEIKNCAFKNCDIIHCCGGAYMDISNIDYAHVHNIVFEDIRAEYDPVIQRPTLQKSDEDTYFIDHESRYRPYLILLTVDYSIYSHGGTVRGKIENVRFKDIQTTSDIMPPSLTHGFDEEHGVKNVTIENLTINGEKQTDLKKAGFTIGEYAEDIRLI